MQRGGENVIKALNEFQRVLKNEGILILNLPAFDFLQSTHDKAVHIQHRFTSKELKKELEAAGFKIERNYHPHRR